MSADKVYFSTRLPIQPDGFLEITIDVKSVAAAAPGDQEFILKVLDKVTAFAMWCMPPQEAAKVRTPEVLRGVAGGRQ